MLKMYKDFFSSNTNLTKRGDCTSVVLFTGLVLNELEV